MEDPSPPKRITRARAAKVSGENNTIKVATAASKARATKAAASTITKRKTRAADTHEPEQEEQQQQQETETASEPQSQPEYARPTRSTRAKKAAVQADPATEVEEMPATTKATRGRAKKTVNEEPNSEPTRATRGRPRKVEQTEPSEVAEAPPVKKATRGRAATASKATTTSAKATEKPSAAVKKTVTFEDEPDKENIIPSTAKGKTKATTTTATGIRAKPVRKPSTTTKSTASATRTTRGRAKTVVEPEEPKEKSPLSPKKPTQVAVAKAAEEVEDSELSTVEQTPIKSMMRSPIKPSGSVRGVAKQLDFTTSILPQTTESEQPSTTVALMTSPARRQPPSPFKNAFRMSPKRPEEGSNSPLKNIPSSTSLSSSDPPPFKMSLLQTPAKRPPSPVKRAPGESATKVFDLKGSAATPRPNALHISRFATTPRTMPKSVSRVGHLPIVSPLQEKSEEVPEEEIIQAELEAADVPEAALPSMEFSGRLSSVLPRDADPALNAEIKEIPSLLGQNHPMVEDGKESLMEEIQEIAELSQAEAEDELNRLEDRAEVDIVVAQVVEDIEEVDMIVASPQTPTRGNASYQLREKDENPFYDSDSEDELSSPKFAPQQLSGLRMSSKQFANASTPKKFSLAKTPGTRDGAQSTVRMARANQDLGFTPLAHQLSKWLAGSPEKSDTSSNGRASPLSGSGSDDNLEEQSPAKSTFFEDEMTIRDAEQLVNEDVEEVDLENDFGEPDMDELDMDLAAEADCMSMLADEGALPDATEEAEEQDDVLLVPNFNSSLSEASQEYGDENAVPIDPALFETELDPAQESLESEVKDFVEQAEQKHTVVTPVRPLRERVIHTVSKIPLKAAGPESPNTFNNRGCATVSQIPTKRPANPEVVMQRYLASTGKKPNRKSQAALESPSFSYTTPSKGNNWSSAATPATTPKRDVNPALLKGAVVFVDVYTTEGADASGIFVDLLTQMGAKCVKTWQWNPSSLSNDDGENEGPHNKIGITHVVFKDGAKRTMEKVRQSNGVVLCVGVGWVLDCERESKWLDESPYMVDNGLVPRGGRRRRKSMEPRALENHNGTIVSTPRTSGGVSSASSSGSSSAKSDRRKSSQWVRTPLAMYDESNLPRTHNDDSLLDTTLSPVPRTPASEEIAAYAASLDFLEDTPNSVVGGSLSGQGSKLPPSQLIQMTVPAKKSNHSQQDWGAEDASGEMTPRAAAAGDSSVYNESVMARLMLARRKSLQFAPKVGSPLAKRHY